ncbi:hypothetical protein W97_09244 [Coniosporium apollinis CBS 100218]|uniref:C2H2-type domain-containing protein n=1 Tax=Coniosporium apollinis (strain CBS 100218) TaxID=1168221 RepID=R7Z7H4_CONA1|nr:uncharacterized protein W97_09244 [Coniosporium apollinis CBS 100218]EON69979.1 hypothetical protein W97_09244 [Coniosporium apollinis CBS 100218]
MAEPVSIVASVVGIASAGIKLSTTLYTYAETAFHADGSIKDIARDVSLTSSVMGELGTLLQQDTKVNLCSQSALQTITKAVTGCNTVFNQIGDALEKSLKKTQDGKKKLSALQRLKWPLLEPRMRLLQSNLESLKSTLLLMLNVLKYARDVAVKRNQESTAEDKRRQIASLIKINQESTQKFVQIEEAFRQFALQGAQNSEESACSMEDSAATSVNPYISMHTVSENISAGSSTLLTNSMPAKCLCGASDKHKVGWENDFHITSRELDTCINHIGALLKKIQAVEPALSQSLCLTESRCLKLRKEYRQTAVMLDEVFNPQGYWQRLAIQPRLMPQNAPPAFTNTSDFDLNQDMNPPFGSQTSRLDLLLGQGQEQFPRLNQRNRLAYLGQADQMSPPEISIDFAPPSRQASFEPPKLAAQENALSPLERSRSRNRMRAKSDSFTGQPSRATTPGSDPSNSLSPNAAKGLSRSPSPSSKGSRRSSTSCIPHRDYILDLAASRPLSNGGDSSQTPNKRTQKYPATFQCNICPKRFTRAYNLRSHLRMHTNEHPFVCNICGKAFARQHDCKRHEGLHVGEKKFVCRGMLKDGNNWGCGRRFARADALGRHFRSEGGCVCIRPLLDEEVREKGWEQQQQQQQGMDTDMLGSSQMGPQVGLGMQMSQPPQQGGFGAATFPQSSSAHRARADPAYALPAALLAQYPALAGFQWDLSAAEDGFDGGRSSFNASSGGEIFGEDEEFGASGRAGRINEWLEIVECFGTVRGRAGVGGRPFEPFGVPPISSRCSSTAGSDPAADIPEHDPLVEVVNATDSQTIDEVDALLRKWTNVFK